MKALLVVLAGCGSDVILVSPVVDLPTNESAQPFVDIDSVVVDVAHAGQDTNIVSQTFSHGESIDLTGVPFDNDLVIHLHCLIGTGEVSYGRTCTFAFASDTSPTPHLYISRIVKFGALAQDAAVRSGGFGVAVDTLGVVVGGVDASGQPVTAIEQFDPATGALQQAGTIAARRDAQFALLGTAPARLAVVGGTQLDGSGAGFAEVVSPDADTTDRIDRIDAASLARVGLSATTLGDGRVLVAGGAMPGQPPTGELDVLDATSGTAELHQIHAALAVPRTGHTATLLGDDLVEDVLIAGGVDASGKPIAGAELYKPLGETLAPQQPALLVPRSGHRAILLPDNSVLLVGGVDANGPVRVLERYDPDTGFTSAGMLPDGAGALDFSATRLADGRVLLAGGRATPGGPALDTAFIAQLDPTDGTVDVVATDRLTIPRAGHQAMLLCDGTVLLTGGTDPASVAERYDPPATARR